MHLNPIELRFNTAPRRGGGRAVLCWMIGTCVALAVTASPAVAKTLSFVQSVTLALKQNPTQAASVADVAAAKAAVREARGQTLPRLSASWTASRTDDPLSVFGAKLEQRQASFNDFGAGQFDPGNLNVEPHNLNYPGSYDNFRTRLQIDIPIYHGGALRARLTQARAAAAAARSGDAAAAQQLAFQVLQAYETVEASRAFVSVTGKAEQAAAQTARSTQLMFDRGVSIKSDLLTAQVRLEEAKLQVREARNRVATALEHYHLILGLPIDAEVDVGRSARPPVPATPRARLANQALLDNPHLAALQKQLEARDAGIDAAKGAYLPHLDLSFQQDWNQETPGFENPSYAVFATVSWDIFDFGSRRGAVDRATASRLRANAKLREARDEVLSRISEALRNARVAADRVSVKALTVKRDEEAQRLLSLRYSHGATTLTDLLAGQSRLDQARADLVSARYQRTMQRAAVWLATGRMRVQDLTRWDQGS